MPDSITPVGAMVNPPNPQAGMNTLSSILGIQQQSQNLQTGAYRQQEAQAGAQSAQQAMSERQIMVQSLRSGRDPDGNSIMASDPDPVTGRPAPDPTKLMALARRWMPQTGDSVIQNITKTQTDKAQLAEATRGLEQNYRNDLSGIYQSFKNNPNAKSKDVNNAADEYVTKNPGALAAVHWASNLIDSHFDNMTGAQKNDALQHVAQVFQPAATTMAQNLPQQATTGAGTVNRNVLTGAISAPPGAAPGTALNPTPPQVAAATAAGTGQVGTDNAIFARAMAAGANAQRGVELAQKVEQEAGMVRTGQFSQEFANRLTVLQQHDPSVTARQLLQKDAMNLKTLAEEGATTDAERNQIGGGFPSPETMDPDAVQKAARYWQGSFRMAGARRDNAIAHVSQNGTAGLAVKDAQFMSTASPGRFAPPEPKKPLPTGAKLDAYAKAHFGGDTTKASAYLKQQGYE